jgi:hypothetical protein
MPSGETQAQVLKRDSAQVLSVQCRQRMQVTRPGRLAMPHTLQIPCQLLGGEGGHVEGGESPCVDEPDQRLINTRAMCNRLIDVLRN